MACVDLNFQGFGINLFFAEFIIFQEGHVPSWKMYPPFNSLNKNGFHEKG